VLNNLQVNNPAAKAAVTVIGNCFIVFIAVYCTFGALLSSFSLTVNTGVTFWIWLLAAVAVSLLTMLYGSKGILFVMIPAALLILWMRHEILEGAGFIIYSITDYYSQWLSVTVLFSDFSEFSDELTVFIAFAGIIIILMLAYSVCVRRSIFLTVLATAPYVFLTFVITDLKADTVYLMGLIAVYLTLLISSAFNPDDFIKRGLMLLPAFIISILLMTFAYIIAPSNNYSREEHIVALGNRFRYIASQMGRLGQMFRSGSNALPEFGWLTSPDGLIWYFNTDNVSVADAGNRSFTNQSLLEIIVDTPGTFYIRGYSMQDFDGSKWSISTDLLVVQNVERSRDQPTNIINAYIMNGLPNPPELSHMLINRTGDMTTQVAYQPYYRTRRGILSSSRDEEQFFHVEGSIHRFVESLNSVVIVINDLPTAVVRNITEEFPVFAAAYRGRGVFEFDPGPTAVYFEELMEGVAFMFHDVIDDYEIIFPFPSGSMLDINANIMLNEQIEYSAIDPDTAEALRMIAIEAGIDPEGERLDVVDAVSEFIRSSAEYSLTPGRVPEDENFAVYFLNELREGYCIHFATAATLMLRALDIPARFTSGYVVSVTGENAGSTVVLTDRNAHAWVEVFYDDVGWLYLEVTPSSSLSIIPQARAHSPQVERPAPPTSPGQMPDDFMPPDQEPGAATNLPQAGAGGGQNARGVNIPEWMINTGTILIYILSIIPILIIRRFIVKKFRSKGFYKENTNEAVIYMWRYVLRLSKRESVPPNDIEELALKARFSQHRLTEEERMIMVRYADRLAYEIYAGKGDYGRLQMKFLKALY